jgi:hypothetical protein
MIARVVFDDGTILEQAVDSTNEVLELGLVFMDEPGFNNVTLLRDIVAEAGAVPKMRHYITTE